MVRERGIDVGKMMPSGHVAGRNTIDNRNKMTAKTVEKKTSAKTRQTARNQRTSKEQLALLDERFGQDVGATKERQRLLLKIKEEK